MVLFQIFMNGYTSVNGVNRITGTATHGFTGKCRIRFTNYNLFFSTSKVALVRVDSDQLYGQNTQKFNIIVPLDSSLGIGLSKDSYYWDVDLVQPYISVDIVELDQPPGSSTPIPSTVFNQALLTFDIEKLE